MLAASSDREKSLGRGRRKGRSRKEAGVDGIPFEGSYAVRGFFCCCFSEMGRGVEKTNSFKFMIRWWLRR